MIFVTVGTHEQQFNRLVEYMDKWAGRHNEEVIIQTGYSTYEPKFANWSKLFSYDEMINKIDKARIVITHGGPSSFIIPLQIEKTPIVVPREKIFGEHINDHQVKFCRQVANRMGTIIVVEDVDRLEEIIDNYDNMKKREKHASNNTKFCTELENIVSKMFEGKR